MRCAALCASMMTTWYDAEHGLKISIFTKTSYAYDEIGRLIEKLLPNGVKQDYSYLPGGNLESMTSIDKEGILDKYFYSYDNSGLISGINRSRRDLDAISGQYEYQYDAIGRLTSSILYGQLRASYEYDAFGNRTSLI
ncbi:RHS repeat domain-containing protein [Butyrivibrio fibrisolvens]|uniref:RHS repeat domain-containing protein n=1 Tax=Butyrivibrio fibrisolvens TaxID=831 RepID=UPI0020BEC973|nr:RHS repeat domain-containing protein [Butyrivibrio fibrisolvens]